MTSPYDNNVGSNWGPPAGISSMLAMDRQTAMQGMADGAKAFDAAVTGYKQLQDEGKAADYLFKAHPEYLDQLGIHPEEYKTMGALDKSRAGAAVMQKKAMDENMAKMQDLESQTNERNSIANWRTTQAKTAAAEDEGLARMAKYYVTPQPHLDGAGMMMGVTPTPLTEQAPAQQLSPQAQELLNAAAQAGPMNKLVQSRVMRELLPQIASTGMDQQKIDEYMSSSGNNYVRFKNTLLRDAPQTDPSSVSPPDGYDAVSDGKGNIRYVKKPTVSLPDSFYMKRDKLSEQIAQAQQTVGASDDELQALYPSTKPSIMRRQAKASLQAAQEQAKNFLNSYHITGKLTDDQLDQFNQEFGLAQKKSGAAASTPGNAKPIVPKAGDVVGGYKFIGGDPKDPKSWQKTDQ